MKRFSDALALFNRTINTSMWVIVWCDDDGVKVETVNDVKG